MNEAMAHVHQWLVSSGIQILLIGVGVALGNFVNDFLQRRRN